MLAEMNDIRKKTGISRITNYEKTKFDVSLISINFTDSIKGESEYSLDDPQMLELAESIKTVGLIQPIVIRKTGNVASVVDRKENRSISTFQNTYEVVAGRRRFTAVSKILKWNTVDAIVRDYDDSIDTLAVQFQENEERKAWTDFNYATAIKMLKEKKPGISTIDIAKTFNKTADWVKKKNDHIRVIDSFEKVNGEGATSHLADLSTSEINATGQVKDETARVDLITDILDAKGRGEDLTISEIREKAASQGQAKRKEHNENLPPAVRKFKPVQQELIPKTDYQIYEELRENILEWIRRISVTDNQIELMKDAKDVQIKQKEEAEKAFKKFETEKKTVKLRSHSTKKIEAIQLKRFPFETCYPYRENKTVLDPYYKKGWIRKETMETTLKMWGSESEMKFSDIKKGTLVFVSREVNGEVSGWFKCEVV